jgi:hypothetical protein
MALRMPPLLPLEVLLLAPPGSRVTERQALEEKYRHLVADHLALGRDVTTYVPNKREPVHGWYRYKEAFSRKLVHHILREHWRLPVGSLVFDPFGGCGTTLLEAQRLGYPSIGVDAMPVSVFIADVKLRACAGRFDPDTLAVAVEQLLATPFVPPVERLPDVRIVRLGLPEEAQQQIVFYRTLIRAVEDADTRDFLMFGLLAVLEECSRTSKDGQFLRLVKRSPRPVRDALRDQYAQMVADLRLLASQRAGTAAEQQLPFARMVLGDARALPPEVLAYAGQVAGVITSPPYLNRYDYSRTYALELLVNFTDSFDGLRAIRHSLLRSHIESRPPEEERIQLPALLEILQELPPVQQLNNPRIPIMIRGYFEDMDRCLEQIAAMVRPGGRIALVVANARFEGQMVPVDLMLSELAKAHGMQTEAIWVTRYKGNSSQQMGKYGRVPVRESICFWRKRCDGAPAR